VFTGLTLHGATASLLWGYRTAAELRTWRIYKRQHQWMLSATLGRVSPFEIRQRGLQFAAPREQGFWYWRVDSTVIADGKLVAKLGPPEH